MRTCTIRVYDTSMCEHVCVYSVFTEHIIVREKNHFVSGLYFVIYFIYFMHVQLNNCLISRLGRQQIKDFNSMFIKIHA